MGRIYASLRTLRTVLVWRASWPTSRTVCSYPSLAGLCSKAVAGNRMPNEIDDGSSAPCFQKLHLRMQKTYKLRQWDALPPGLLPCETCESDEHCQTRLHLQNVRLPHLLRRPLQCNSNEVAWSRSREQQDHQDVVVHAETEYLSRGSRPQTNCTAKGPRWLLTVRR
jgi:hypothetical protein